ncbi:MAG TPA: alkaline phosphatase family protein [Solirubrobacterales bacterium]|nr:alkaline phosphatase family protein [Solirubrobacterales bacterium]
MTGKTCSECGAARALDQRYCLQCGARLGSLPAAIAAQIGRVRKFATGRFPAVKPSVPGMRGEEGSQGGKPSTAKDGAKRWPFVRSDFMPSPRAAAAAVIGMLALGVVLGSATNQLARSAGLSTILLEEEAAPPVEEETTPATASAKPEPEETAEETAPVAVPPSVIPTEAPVVEEPLPSAPEPEAPVVEEELPTGLPEVKHVFLVVLGEGGYEETFGKASLSEFLGKELPAQGELLPNYFAVAKGELANQIALISGQGPTLETEADCPTYADVAPGTESVEGQVEGNGCVYPPTTKTLPGQMTEKGLTWRAYIDQEEGVEGAPATTPQPTGCYVTRRNPFAYFHSILDDEECGAADVGLARLAKDLTLKSDKFPAFAYISPDPAKSEETLKTIIPAIQESFAYKDGGLIVITSAEAPQEGEKADGSACCVYPDYLNLPPEGEEPPTGPVKEAGGGGRVGALLISPFVEPGTSSETYFNHFSLLVTIEELFGLERIGYAAEPALAGFDETIFNAAD